jgi:beta-N-acetylhexosaminidase
MVVLLAGDLLVNPVRKLIHLAALLALLLAIGAPVLRTSASTDAQDGTIQRQVQQIMKNMTPEEKVGQLFLITFKGRQVDSKSQIYSLIASGHIGGVVLRSANDNFTSDQTVTNAYQLVSQLQAIPWDTAPTGSQSETSKNPTPDKYIPLFVGLSQEGDGYPYDQVLDGLTPLPNLMAIGATWNMDQASKVGSVLGQEMSALGINLYMGPSMDVLDQPYTDSGYNLGTRSFGGSAFWTGQMGQAYISGIHQGSAGRMSVIARNFPGWGSSDRMPETDAATVRKSLDQLNQNELPPFYAVTGNAPDADATADGLLVANVRYQGLTDNLRRLTRPVSLDAQVLSVFMGQPQLSEWRKNGGLLVSDDLGGAAVRSVYDPSLKEFKATQVALDAFLAGNDLLYVDNFIATGDPDAAMTISRTLSLFAQRYRTDTTFAQRVDESVGRILAAKLKMYPTLDLTHVVPSQTGLEAIGSQASRQVTYDVASQAVTLISPTQADLDSSNLPKPDRNDRFVFLTDTQTFKQCSQCPDQDALGALDLQNAIMKLYGPTSSSQFSSSTASSYSFTDLQQFLSGQVGNNNKNMEDDIRSADWVVVSILAETPDRPASSAFRRLLSDRPDLFLKNQHIILFAFNAPFYLDATDISKLTAYYGLYGKSGAFLETAAKVLFREIIPSGASPVSVLGAGYDLTKAILPDKDQVIPLDLDVGNEPTPVPNTTPEATQIPEMYKVGDTIPLRTGQIYDANHHVVPDGTVVSFIFIRNADTTTTQQIVATTTQGVARAAYKIDNSGLLEIRATSNPALTSLLLHINVSKTEVQGITVIAPTPLPTNTSPPTLTPTITPTSQPTPLPPAPVRPEFGDWLLAMLTIAFTTALIYFAGSYWATLRWAVRWGLCAMVGGLIAYLYIAIDMPGSASWLENSGRAGMIGFTLLGVMVGWGAGFLWRAWLEHQSIQRMSR